MKKRVYIETTVASYYTAKPSRDLLAAGHQEATRELWPKLNTEYETYVSALVYEEAARGDPNQARMRLAAIKPFPMLDVDDEAGRWPRRSWRATVSPKSIPKTLFTLLWPRPTE